MKPLFAAMVVLAALMPSVPEPTNPFAIAVSVSAGLLLLLWFMTNAIRGAFPKSASGAWLVVFVALALLSSMTAVLYETPLDLWLRGAIPFLFLLTFFPALQLARRDPHWVLDVLHLSAVAWLVNTLAAAVVAVPAVLSGEVQRITHATEAWAAFQLPYAMVGLAITLFHRSRWLHAVRWPLAFLFSCVPLFAVSRGQLAAVVAIWLFYLVRLPAPARRRAALPALLLGIGVAILVGQSALWESLLQRFSDTGAEGGGSRWLELQYAFAQFLESPLLGKGLGHQIPAEVTFAGDWETIASAGVDSVGYMHNVIGYLLMNLGLPGLVAYFGFVVSPLHRSKSAMSAHAQTAWWAAAAVVCALLLWFALQAAFRLIHCNVLLAVAVGVLAALKVKRSRGAIRDAHAA